MKRLHAASATHADERLVISVDGVVVGSPLIRSAIAAQAVLSVQPEHPTLLDTIACQLGVQDD